ncbi:MAG TPA: IPT/TIG domain-containing protein [Cyclobacteriaceae bacterium]
MKIVCNKLVNLLCILVFLVGCKKSDEPAPQLSITSFTPTSGAEGTSVTITGQSFSTTAANNVVKFNGTTATVMNATATEITTNVPAGATSGKITVTVNGATATSATDFTFLPTPVITSFTPGYYLSGSTLPSVVISGSNFSTTTTDNVVKFNGATATVSAATATQLTATLPGDATSGKITVTVNGVTGSSETDFLIGCPDLIISNMAISNVAGNNFTVTYDIKNIGAIPMEMHTMYIQSYVSTDGVAKSVASGGFADYGPSELDLGPNETRQKVQSISGTDIATNQYVIFDLLSSSAGPSPECNVKNNEASKKIQ